MSCQPAMAQTIGVRAKAARGAPLIVGSVALSFAGPLRLHVPVKYMLLPSRAKHTVFIWV